MRGGRPKPRLLVPRGYTGGVLLLRTALLSLVVAAVLAPAAEATSVRDRDIGWPQELLRELGLQPVRATPCPRTRITARTMRVQSLISRADPRDALYTIFHDRPAENIWGNLWYDPCDQDRLQVGIASGGSRADTRRAVRDARALLARRGLSRLVRLRAVRSTYRELSDEADAIGRRFNDLLDAALISTGIDTSRNTIEIELARRVTKEQGDRLRAAAAASSVNVVVHVQPAPPPTYQATFSVDRGAVDRASPRLALTIFDSSCGADETHDSPQRFAGVSIVKGMQAWVLTARFRTMIRDDLSVSACEGNSPELDVVRTTVTLPGPLGDRAVVDGTPGPSDLRFVELPPVSRTAIRSLVPRFIYTGRDCDAADIRAAFRGRPKDSWCYF